MVRNLRIRSERDRPAEDAAAGGPATEDVTLTVTNATDSGVDFDWSSDNLAIEGLGSTAFLGPDERELLESVVTPTLQYRLDRFGVLDEVLNLDELQASVLEFARLVAEVDPEAAEFAEFFEQLDSTSLALLFIEKPAVYHFHDETFVDLAQPIVFDDFLPNALGGEAFPAVTSVEVIASQPDDDCLVIITTTEPDPEQFAEILLATVENVFGTVPDEGLDTGEWRIVTTNVARVDAVTGLLSSSVTDQTVTVDGVEAGERLIIVDVTESLTE